MAKSVSISTVLFILLLTSCATEEVTESRGEEQAAVSKYGTMSKEDLQHELRELQVKYLAADAARRGISDQYRAAEREHRTASGEDKADALLRKLEIRASLEELEQAYRNVRREFDEAQEAYKSLLKTEL